MTKAVTGSAALQLVEQDMLSLDDPAWKYLPELDQEVFGVASIFQSSCTYFPLHSSHVSALQIKRTYIISRIFLSRIYNSYNLC
jgi:hypothetical protein